MITSDWKTNFLGSAIGNAQRIVRRTRILILRCKGTTRLGRIGDLRTTVEGEGTENLFFPTLVSSVSRNRTLRLALFCQCKGNILKKP